jgi:LEA14-like dessication related protein
LLSIHDMKWKYLPLLFLLVITGCAKVQDPVFKKVGNFRIKGFGITETKIGFDVTYFNPNNFGVTVKEAQADVYIDSLYLGKFVQDTTIAVKKNADFSIPLTGSISMATALKMDLKNLDTRDILLKADGNVRVGKAGVYISKPVHYLGKHRLDEIQIKF